MTALLAEATRQLGAAWPLRYSALATDKATDSRKWKAVMLDALPPAQSAVQQAARPA